jgi:hypothetical protein
LRLRKASSGKTDDDGVIASEHEVDQNNLQKCIQDICIQDICAEEFRQVTLPLLPVEWPFLRSGFWQ